MKKLDINQIAHRFVKYSTIKNVNDYEKWVKGCLSKKCYKTIEFAEVVAKKVSKVYNKEHRVYYCNKCMNFHLTTKVLKNGK